MKKKKKEISFQKVRLIIVMVSSLVVLSFLLGTFVGASFRISSEDKAIEKFNDKDIKKAKPVDGNEEQTKNYEKDYEVEKILYDTTDYGNDTIELVELTTDKKIIATIKENNKIIKKEKIADSVIDTYLVHVGMSDTCEGNARLIILSENNNYSYLNIDALTCGHEISLKELKELNNIVSIEEVEEKSKYRDEPNNYIVYAIDKNDNRIDISDKLE